jgi:hypothetical protein
VCVRVCYLGWYCFDEKNSSSTATTAAVADHSVGTSNQNTNTSTDDSVTIDQLTQAIGSLDVDSKTSTVTTTDNDAATDTSRSKLTSSPPVLPPQQKKKKKKKNADDNHGFTPQQVTEIADAVCEALAEFKFTIHTVCIILHIECCHAMQCNAMSSTLPLSHPLTHRLFTLFDCCFDCCSIHVAGYYARVCAKFS